MPLDSTTQIQITFPDGSKYLVWDEGVVVDLDRLGIRSKGVVKWRCAWADAFAIGAKLLGGSTGSGITLYNNGLTISEFPNYSAQHVKIVGDGIPSVGPLGWLVYQRAELLINFGFPDYAAGNAGTNIGEIEIDFASHSVSLDYGSAYFKYSSDNAVIPGSAKPVMELAGASIKFTLYNRVNVNLLGILPFMNTINSAPFLGVGAGQLYFSGAQSRMKMTVGGLPNYDIAISLAYHPIANGFNCMPRPGQTPLWKEYTLIGGQPEFTSKDFNLLMTGF